MYVYTVTEPSQQEERAEHRVAMVVCVCMYVCMYVYMYVCLSCNEMWVVESDKTRRRGYGGARVVYRHKGTRRQL